MRSESSLKTILKSIPWKFFKRITLSQALLMAFIIITTGLSSRYFLKVYITNQAKNQLVESLELIKHSIETQKIDPVSWCNSLKLNWKTRYTLIDKKGSVLCDNYLDAKSLDNHLYRPEIHNLKNSNVTTAIRYSSSTNYEMIYGAIKVNSHDLFFIRQSLPLSEVNNAMKELDKSVLIFFIPLLFLTILISLATSLQITTPLKSLLDKISEFENLKITSKNFDNALSVDDEWHFVERTLDRAEDELAKFIEELQLQNKKFSILMDSISDSILAIDNNEKLLFMNKRYIKTFQNSKFKDFRNKKLVEVTRSKQIHDIFRETLLTKEIIKKRSIELPVNSSTSMGWFDLKASPLLSEDGEVLGAVCSLNNVSDLKLADQMREDFVTNVSHEVRTPLTAMKGYVQILAGQEGISENEVAKEAISKIEHNSNRLGVLFQEILNLSMIESMNKITRSEISSEDLTSQSLSNIKQVHRDINKDIVTIYEKKTLWADVNLLEQVLTNLFDNIYKYANADGLLKISWLSQNEDVVILIEDDGPGIDSKHHARIFERFYRVDSARSSDRGGTGLGLSIVKHIVQKHGGEISISSNDFGGNTFKILIPQKA